MTAIGLSSYQLFTETLTFDGQQMNFPSVFDIFRKNIVRFYEKVTFWFDRVLGPFLKILCFSLCTPSCYYFFKIMTSWLILTSFCDFFGFLGPPNEKFKLFFPEPFLTCPETRSVNYFFRSHFWHPSMEWRRCRPPAGQIFEKWHLFFYFDDFCEFLDSPQAWNEEGAGLRRVRFLKNGVPM